MNQSSSKGLVLVVEDNDDVRDIITIYLRRNGYAISEASDGVAALETLATIQPDLVLLDVLLPQLDGIEVLKQMRSSSRTRHLPVIMMSAVLQTRDLKTETDRLNVRAFLQKPFQMRTLVESVNQAIAAKGAESPKPSEPAEPNVVPSDSKGVSAPAPSKSEAPQEVARSVPGEERRLQMTRKQLVSPGKLEDLPVPEILHAIFIDSSTGHLKICSGTTEKLVFFQNGLPVYSESSIPEETLGSHLLRRGLITKEQHGQALQVMTDSGRHFGEVLLKLGLVGPHVLFTEIESHLTEKVISTFGWQEGRYFFEEGDSWKDSVIVARMKAGRILLTGVQRFWTPKDVQKRIRITDGSRTFPLDASPYSEEHLGLSTQETRILQMVRRGLSVGDIVRQVRDLNLVVSTLYALYVMEHLGFVLAPPKEAPKHAVQEAVYSKSEKDEYAKALLAEYIKFRTADYFKLLGVSRGATAEEVTEAFQKRQKRYHPDTLVGIDTRLVHEKIEELYVRIHDAYRTLMVPEERRRYIQELDGKVPGAPSTSRPKTIRFSTIQNKPEDVMQFEEGFSFLRNGDYDKAYELFTKALETNPQTRYEAYQIWSYYLQNPPERKDKTEKILLKFFKENPGDALYPYLLGNFAQREKDKKKAVQFYERALEIDPQHIDSARQLRILKMRQKTSEVSGLFDLFKKK
jgi:DNA-binding response OmpR family regulator/curved DNA-binding protein CbpA